MSSWNIEGSDLTVMMTIPANTTATVYVPAVSIDALTESGIPAARAAGLKFVGMQGDSAVFEAGSGSYEFLSKGYRKP